MDGENEKGFILNVLLFLNDFEHRRGRLEIILFVLPHLSELKRIVKDIPGL